MDDKKMYCIEEAIRLGNKDIKYLGSGREKYQHIPDQVFEFTNLRRLNISLNELEEIPDQIGNLEKLDWLSVECNKIKLCFMEI